jgi:aerobic C4-dicarboxylate transport protein
MAARLLKNATLQILLAIACGIALGLFDPQRAMSMKFLSDTFIRVIGWLLPFMMFLLVASGVAGLRGQGRGLSVRAAVYFQLMGMLSLALGAAVALLLRPGVGHGQESAMPGLPAGDALGAYGSLLQAPWSWTAAGQVLGAALSHSLILQVMLAGLLFGLWLGHGGAAALALRGRLEWGVELLFKLLRKILLFAPLAAFGAMAFTFGKYGPGSTWPLLKFVAVLYLACGLFVMVALAALARLAGARLWRLILFVKEELLLVIFTGSSVAAMPGLVTKLQRLGCDQQVVRLVLSTGYTFNLNGSNIYLTTAVLFLAQMAGVELSALQVATLLLVALVTSLGSTSMAGSAFFTLIATLDLLHLVPLDSVGLLLGVERLMKCRSVTNVLGNCVACLVVARWQQALDRPALEKGLSAG